MVITGSILSLGVVVTVVSQLAEHRFHDPRAPFWIGLVLTVLAPAFLTALAIETILLFTWNPLIWLE